MRAIKQKCVWLAATCLLLSVMLPGAKAEDIIPTVTIPLVEQAPVLDGSLSDSVWQKAALIENFKILKKDEAAKQTARLMFDAAWLYIACEINHPKPSEITVTVFERSVSVCRDDSIEIFFDPGTDGKLYYQFALNADNIGGERRNIRGASDLATQVQGPIPWRHATRRTETGWSAETAFPLTMLASYGDLSRARLNVCINRIVPVSTVEGVTSGQEKEGITWAPISSSFHGPGRFGYLKGLGETPLQAPFFPLPHTVAVSDYDVVKNEYTIQVELENIFGTAGKALIAANDQPVSGEGAKVKQTLSLKGGEKQTVELQMPVQTAGARKLKVELRDADHDFLFRTVELQEKDMAGLNLLQVYADRSYYTAEKTALIVCQVNAAPAGRHNLFLQACDKDNQIVSKATITGPEIRLPLNLTGLKTGEHLLTAQLCRNDGGVIAGQPVKILKKAPNPVVEWKIDHLNRILLKNGEPFFPFGIFAQVDLPDDISWQELSKAFNCVLDISRQSPECEAAAVNFIAQAAKYNLDVFTRVELFCPPAPRVTHVSKQAAARASTYEERSRKALDRVLTENMPHVIRGIEAVKNMPNLIGYYLWDEPNTSYDMNTPGRAYYKQVKESDGYRPSMVGYAAYIPAGDEYTDWFDILGTDPYWIPGGPAHIGSPNWVSRRTREIAALASPARFRQPTIIIPMSDVWSGTFKRGARPIEQRAQTYLALIHGAKGIMYWPYPVRHQATIEVMTELGQEMKVLGPMIIMPSLTYELKYTQRELRPEANSFPDVQAALFSNPAGGFVLLAANSRPFPVDFSCGLDNLPEGNAIRQFFSDNRLSVKDGVFEERLDAFATRAYIIESPQPRKITVNSVGLPELVEAEPAACPKTGRPGMKNILPNSGFEECGLPGLPDYVLPIANRPLKEHYRFRPGAPEAYIKASSENPYHGKYCLRLLREPTEPNRSAIGIQIAPNENHPQPYVFSCYLRANRPGVQMRIESSIGGRGGLPGWAKSFDLTTEWQRYYVSSIIPAGLDQKHLFFIWIKGEPNDVLWMDAMQFERGSEPTEYEP